MNKKIILPICLGLLLIPTIQTAYAANTNIMESEQMNAEILNTKTELPIITPNPNKETTQENEKLDQNPAPFNPTITGPTTAQIGNNYEYQITAKDPQNDNIHFKIRYSDSPCILITEETQSGQTITIQHTFDNFYQKTGPYYIHAQAIDNQGHTSKWTTYTIEIDNQDDNLDQTTIRLNFFKKIFAPILEKIPVLETLLSF